MFKHIKVRTETKRKFDKLQADIKYKEKNKINKDKLILLLINKFKEK